MLGYFSAHQRLKQRGVTVKRITSSDTSYLFVCLFLLSLFLYLFNMIAFAPYSRIYISLIRQQLILWWAETLCTSIDTCKNREDAYLTC